MGGLDTLCTRVGGGIAACRKVPSPIIVYSCFSKIAIKCAELGRVTVARGEPATPLSKIHRKPGGHGAKRVRVDRYSFG
jgi:hypothetical protein